MPSSPRSQPREVVRMDASKQEAPSTDRVVVEEPLEIRVNGGSLAVTMRTPGDDEALARGFMLTEGLIDRPNQIAGIKVDAGPAEQPQNVVAVELAPDTPFDLKAHARQFFATSSCGICGKSTLEAVRLRARPVVADWKIRAARLLAMPGAMRERQKTFSETGSLHAAALFDREGRLLELAEDVGRHNAVDKVIGRAAKERWPLEERILFVSGRVGFEIAQKGVMAGIAVIGAVSGASTLAVDLAEEQGLTLAGFVRDGSMTVYAGGWRLENGGG